MQVIAKSIASIIDQSSWIRRMFEAGIELKKKHGDAKVFDFSLGNPDLPPPAAVREALAALLERASQPLAFGYVPNAGLGSTRQVLAQHLAVEQQVPLTAAQVIICCGAAGALNAFFHTVLEAGDEVVCPIPYFVEYGFYAANHGGKLIAVPSQPSTFALDLAAIEAAITRRTRAVIVNSPNNPSGQIYSRQELAELAELLRRKSAVYDRPIYLVSDEPYRFLAFDGAEVPPILPLYEFSVVVGSFSKSLSLAGERVGYLAVNPDMGGVSHLLAGLTLCNRILGFVNAPIIGQLIIEQAIHSGVDISIYDRRRQSMAALLRQVGIDFTMPKGAFYFFPKAPGNDEMPFIDALLAENVLAVPGRGFGCPGHFRLTFCMDQEIIERATPAFARAVARIQG